MLLILLALYDLFAVLSPCGPLKALVNLMSQSDAPHLPGLLYEANLNVGQYQQQQQQPSGRTQQQSFEPNAHTNSRKGNAVSTTEASSRSEEKRNGQKSTVVAPSSETNAMAPPAFTKTDDNGEETKSDSVDEVDRGIVLCSRIPLGLTIACKIPMANGQPIDTDSTLYSPEELQEHVDVMFSENGPFLALHDRQSDGQPLRYDVLDSEHNGLKVLFVDHEGRVMEDKSHLRQKGTIPLAIAKLNKLRFVHGPQPSWVRRAEHANQDDDNIPQDSWTPEELQRDVEVFFPKGWQIVRHTEQRKNEAIRYAVIKPDGTTKRIIFVNHEGKVFEDRRDSNKDDDENERRGSIRLGLGDFIFYSILVSKAALYSFTTFAACVPAVLLGLALTLGILAYSGKALPALPISIFLGVTFYFLTRYSVQPWYVASIQVSLLLLTYNSHLIWVS